MNLRAAIAAVLLLVATAVPAQSPDCVSALKDIALPSVFPNRPGAGVAWTGTVLGVAKNENSLQKPIYVATYSEALEQLTPDRLAAGSTLAGALDLVWTGSEFGLFYQTQGYQLMLQRVSATGEPFGAPIPVAPRVNFPGQEYDIIWDDTRNAYVIVHTTPSGIERGLWLSVVTAEGRTTYDQPIAFFFQEQATPRVAVSNNGTLAVIFAPSDTAESLHVISLDANNVQRGRAPLSVRGRHPELASSGNGFAVVVVTPVTAGTTELHWIRLDANAQVSIGEELLLASRGVDIAPVDLEWNPQLNEWAVSYLDSILGFSVFPGDYRLRRFSPTGTLISDTLFSPDPTKNIYPSHHPFVWTGRSYITDVDRYFGAETGSDAYLIRHCPLAAFAASDKRLLRITEEVTFTAQASGGSPDYTYVWDFGDLSEVRTGATVSHRYTRTGTYTITLRVTDVAGARSFTTVTVQVVTARRRTSSR